MKTETNQAQSEQLGDRFDVLYKNRLTKGQWHRWMMAPRCDIAECHKWIQEYNTTWSGAGGMIRIPAEKDLVTTFRIVRLKRTVEAEVVK